MYYCGVRLLITDSGFCEDGSEGGDGEFGDLVGSIPPADDLKSSSRCYGLGLRAFRPYVSGFTVEAKKLETRIA